MEKEMSQRKQCNLVVWIRIYIQGTFQNVGVSYEQIQYIGICNKTFSTVDLSNLAYRNNSWYIQQQT